MREKISQELNDRFRDAVIEAMREKWGIEVENHFDIFGGMQLITTRVDGHEFTNEEFLWLGGFSEGFAAAMSAVRK